MFDYESTKPKEPPDYTNVKLGLMLAPIVFLIHVLINADIAMSASIVLGVIVAAIKFNWHLRRHVWFWVTISIFLALHVPLVLTVRWPPRGNLLARTYGVPVGYVDYAILAGALWLAGELFSKGSSNEDYDHS